MPASQSERSLQARLAALTRWSCEDPKPQTARMREAFDARFYIGIPEDLPPAERDRRAAAGRAAYFVRLSLASAKARRRSHDQTAVAKVDADLDAVADGGDDVS